jgi:hypothetical protein
MTPEAIMLLLFQASKLAIEISEMVVKEEITPEEAMNQWKESQDNWLKAANIWKNTPAGE